MKLGTYPYTYARVSVMKSLLLKEEDYHRLTKMGLSEIIGFLQNSQYREAINALAVSYSGVDLLERALNQHLVDTWNKLKRISPDEVDMMIDAYLQRFDLYNLKTILRSIHAQDKDEAQSLLIPAGSISEARLHDLLALDTVPEFLSKLSSMKISSPKIAQAAQNFSQSRSIIEIENALEQYYYDYLVGFTQLIPSRGELFRNFLEDDIETQNILTTLRLQRAGFDTQKIAPFLLGIPSRLVKSLLADKSTDAQLALLRDRLSEEGALTFPHSLTIVELDLERSLLKRTKTMLRQKPLSVDVILGYMFAKEIEVKNLKMMLRSRQLNLDNEFVEQQLII